MMYFPRKIISLSVLVVTTILFMQSAASVFAQGTPTPAPGTPGTPTPAPGNPGTPTPAPGGPQSGSDALINPLSGVTSVNDLLVAILNVLIIIATPIIVIFIILAGFKYVTARGNPSKIEEAHKALTYAIIGGVLIIGAVALSTIVSNLVNAFR